MRYLSVEQLLFLHMRLVQETGGFHGIRDLGMLEAAAARPRAMFGRAELYPTVQEKAAALMHFVVLNHPMVDGNKRLGLAAAGIFLEMNGYQLAASNKEAEAQTLNLASGEVSVEDLTTWFRNHTQRQQRGRVADF